MPYKQRAVVPVYERVMRRTAPAGDCLLWQGALKENGYGTIGMGRAGTGHGYVHRVSYEHHYGPIPRGMDVCHRCDVRNCVRPEHLFLGTHRENMQDASIKARTCRGEARANAKLTEELVRYIRREVAAGRTHQSLADELQVARLRITKVALRSAWAHVP